MRNRLGWLALPLLLAAVISTQASDGHTQTTGVGAAALPAPLPEPQPRATQLALAHGGPVQAGEPFTVRVILTLADGTPVQGAVIDFTVAGRSAGVGITDQHGRSSLTQLATHGAGLHTVIATYGGDPAAHLDSSTAATELPIGTQ